MQPHRLLRASSAQSVCAFCACRLTGEIPSATARTPLAFQQRTYGTSQSLRQDGNSATAPADNAKASAWTGFDPNSSLSASEQKEKAMRLARRKEAEAAELAAAEQRAEEKKRRDEALMAKKPRAQHAQGGHRAQVGRHHQPHRNQSQGHSGAKGDSVFRKMGVQDGNATTGSRASGHQQRQRNNAQDRRGAQGHARKSTTATQQRLPSAPLPSFMQAASNTQEEKPRTHGWGAGHVERKSLEYGQYEPEPEPTPAPAEPAVEEQTGASSADRSESTSQARQGPTPGFGMRAGADARFSKTTQSDAETIYDVLNVGRDPEPEPQSMSYKPDFQREVPTTSPTRGQSINNARLRFTPIQEETTTEDNWQHLRRRQPEAAQPQAGQDQPGFVEEDDSWIDRSFAEHQEARNSRPRPVRATASLQSAAQRNEQRLSDSVFKNDPTKRTCGRCGQKGHVARDCTSPMTRKCNLCGQVGHMARQCPMDKARLSGNNHEEPRFPMDPRQEMLARVQSRFKPADDDAPGEPTERVLKSRKFRDDEPRKEKPTRRGRRDDDDGGRDERRSRRSRDFEDQDDDRSSRKISKKEAKEAEKKAKRAAERAAQHAEQKNQIKLPEFISVQNLAQALGVRYEQFVNRLEDLGYDDVFPGKVLNTEVSGMIAMEYDLEPVFDTSAREDEERDLKARPEVDAQDKELLPTRPPVVTIMGHVDHGKTTILDYLRKSSVAAGEAGGITQHIGAFSVPLSASGKTITFLDTPGHAAFLAMRQRGANVTDIVILVVAADDSVKPQTLEAIKHAKGAGVPMLVAVNKVDKDSADVQRVKQDLARHGVEIEDFGGDTQVVEVSGKTGQGMAELEEAAVTLSEILDHRAETDGAVEGWVLEATTKKAGRVATVLVRRGTLKQGAVIVAGNTWARVRSLRNEAGIVINEAGPGMPVEVDGWRDQPAAGDEVLQAPTEQKATSVVEYRAEKAEREKTAEDMEAINEARRLEQEKREREKLAAQQAKLRENGEDGEAAEEETAKKEEPSTTSGCIEVPFIIKADVSGSAEAVEAYIMSVGSPMVAPRILSTSVGAMHESDVELAATTKGHIIAFNLPSNEGLKATAESKGVKVLENNIIYRVLDDVKAVLEEKLPPIITQRVLGEAEVGVSFEIGIGGRKKMKIAGCKVRNGVIGIGTKVRVMRGEEKVYDGTISSLKNVKKDVQEMRKGTECGMGFDGWDAFEVSDTIQTYEERSEKRSL
ncbi:hypothetical protein Q7P37_006828 [Cladosporium fusiforme]